MIVAFAKRYAGLGIVVFVALLIFVWHNRLLPTVETRLPVFSTHGAAPTHRNIQCPLSFGHHQNAESWTNATSGTTTLTGIPKVIGLVFYGRHATASILDCYLKRNLVKNGGVLDGVLWLERTTDVEDLAFLDKLIKSEPDYTRRKINLGDNRGFSSSYDRIDDEVMYIKIDDDVVYIEDNTIPSMVCMKAARPDYYIVSANVVNQPMISWIHWSLGAIRAYLPEIENPYPTPAKGSHVDWRASQLPDWKGPKDLKIEEWSSSDKTHRWLPLRGKSDHLLDKTPIAETEYSAFGRALQRWQIAAQQHYTFLEHLENNDLWRYKFNIWDFQYLRMGIQFVAIMGKDINVAKPIPGDDEQHFSVTMPRRLGRQGVADGRGMVAHFSFGPQGGLKTTDVLDRYRAYAAENICAEPMLWSPER